MKTVVFDFDGVIHSYTSGWKGATVIPDPPVDGIREAIEEIRENGYKVVVVSSRCKAMNGELAIWVYLESHNIVVDDVMAKKPPAVAYIDDRAICFDGNSAGLLDKIRNFKPWYEKVKRKITTPDAPKLVTVTYAEDRLRHFEQERDRARWAYETDKHSLKNADPYEAWMGEKLGESGRILQFYDDVVAMLKGETDTRAHGRWINCRDGNATCNVCGARQRGVYDDDNEQRYCGGCGAIMDGGTKCEND